MNRRLGWAIAAVCLVFNHGAHAGEREDIEALRATTINLIRLLVEEGVLTRDRAQALIKKAEERAATKEGKPESGSGKAVVRVPFVPELVKQEIREQIKQDVLAQAKTERWGEPNTIPSWLDRITLEGDVRVRHQTDLFQASNTPAPTYQLLTGTPISNTTDDRQRSRVRARLGVYGKVNEWIGAGLRLTTGSGDPISTNQTLGNSFSKYSLFIDRAYLRLDPSEWLTVTGGRIPNPWLGTDLVWNDNLNFEGVAASFKPRLSNDLAAFVTLGAFPIEEVESSPTVRAKDKWLVGAQAGLDFTTPNNSRMKFGVGVYEYKNTHGIPNPTLGSTIYNRTAPAFRQKGNTLFNIDNDGNPATDLFALAAKFRNVNVTASVDLARFDPIHVVLTADYVRNIGFDQAEILSRTGLDIAPRTKGYQLRLDAGMPRIREYGEWQVFAAYKYLERDAVLDGFTDSDFRLGGTDAKGYMIGGAWGIGRNTWLGIRYASANAIDGPPLSVDVLQFDFNVRF